MAGPEIVVRGRGEFGPLDRDLARTQGRLGKFARTAGLLAGAGVVAVGAATAKIGVAAVKSASDAEQSLGATSTVFGKFADQVEKTSDRAAKRFGLSANGYRESANLIGSLFRNQGVSADELAKKSNALIRTGADLAATFGGTAAEAVEALGSAYKGEFDPLERYGISVKQSTVNTEALAVANVKTTKEFEALSLAQQTAAKQQATTNLITKQSVKSAGAFGREQNTLAGQTQRLVAGGQNLSATLGKSLNPTLTTLARVATTDVLPPLQSLAEKYAPKLGKSLGDLAEKAGPKLGAALEALPGFLADLRSSGGSDDVQSIASSFGELAPVVGDLADKLPGLGDVVSVTATVFKFAADNSDLLAKALPFLVAGYLAVKTAQVVGNVAAAASVPLKVAEIAVNARLAASNRALVAARTADTAATRTNSAAQATSAVATGGSARGLSRLGVAARGLAGVGGLVAVTTAGQSSNQALSTLGNTAGAAALGFSLAGPWGAAAGAVVGLGKSLFDFVKQTDEAQRASSALARQHVDAEKAARDYKGTLDALTGATTAETRAQVLANASRNGLLGIVNKLDVSSGDLVSTILGQEGATRRLTRAYRENFGALSGPEQAKFNTFLQDNTRALSRQKGEAQETAAAQRGLSDTLRGFPPEVVTKVRALGTQASIGEIQALKREFPGLTDKQLKTIVRVTGSEQAVRQVRGVRTVVDALGRPVPAANMNPFIGAFAADTAKVRRNAKTTGDGLPSALAAPVGKTKANLTGFASSLAAGAAGVTGTARQGGIGIGSALKEGVFLGFAGAAEALASAAAGAVSGAIGAAKREGEVRSPSRKFREVGEMLGAGLVVGMERQQLSAQQMGRLLARSALKGVVNGAQGVEKEIARITTQIEKGIQKRGKNDKTERLRERNALAALKYQFAALKANGRAQDRLNDKLTEARDAYTAAKDAARDYAAQVKSVITSAGSITSLGEGNGYSSVTQMLALLRGRVTEAETYEKLFARLKAAGLNQTTLDELANAGTAGLGAAQTLLNGGASAIAEYNALASRLASAGTRLGANASDSMHAAGVAAAAGLVAGLESQSAALDRQAVRMGNILARAVRRALKINSPSRVFRNFGKQTALGLTLGLADVDVSGAGARMADQLVSGFEVADTHAATLPPIAASSGPGSASGRVYQINNYVAPGGNLVEAGRQTVKAIKAFESAGGR